MLRKNHLRNLVSKTAAVLFVFSYASALILSQFHQLSHEPETEEICYEEENACHLRLVHNDVENGCDHESHFSDELPTCELCPMLQAKTEASEQEWQFELPEFKIDSRFGEITKANYHTFSFTLANRGPPVSS